MELGSPEGQIQLPFLKWAGGKRWLTSHLSLEKADNHRYIEPFLGSGAMYFATAPHRALLSDANEDLIETYRVVRDFPDAFEKKLHVHARLHCSAYYYEIRSKDFHDRIDRAARFVYLNRTCWNGLYRVNLTGAFNVPIGTKQTVCLATDNWQAIADNLTRACLLAQDFEKTIDCAEDGDVVFADPPYTVNHNTNGFIKYNESIFSWADQVRLAAALTRAANRGAQIYLTNAAHASVQDLYQTNFKLARLSRASVLSGDIKGRGRFEEFLITANARGQ